MIGLQGPSEIMTKDEKLQVFREAGTTWVDGQAVTRTAPSFWICCNVQPLNAKDLMIVPELYRYKEMFWLYAQKPSEVKVNDRVVRNCQNYQVQSVEDWGGYVRARIMRVDVGPEAA